MQNPSRLSGHFTMDDATRSSIAEQLAEHASYGRSHTVTQDDGAKYTLRIEYDQDSTLEGDGDWYGTLTWSTDRQRPAGCDGNAEVVHSDGRNARLWWQPPADVVRGDELFTSLRDRVRGWYRNEWSYVGLHVKAYYPCASCGGGKRADAYLGGVESDADTDTLHDMVQELLREVEAERPVVTTVPPADGG